MRAGMAVRPAITRTVPGTTASSCHSGGLSHHFQYEAALAEAVDSEVLLE